MAYIAPNTTIYFLEKILLTPKYEHTYYFASEADQFNFFYSKRLYERGSQSYQRVGKGQLRVEMTMEEAYRVNYMMFKNTSFENKWFYAFIVGDPVYINNTTVQINYIIDVMQSWYFDYILKPSFAYSSSISIAILAVSSTTGVLLLIFSESPAMVWNASMPSIPGIR